MSVVVSIEGGIRDDLENAFRKVDGEAPLEPTFTRPRTTRRDGRELIQFLVATPRGLLIEMYINEHPPPHFHVTYQERTASFSILDCKCLQRECALERYQRQIKRWWKNHRKMLEDKWNESRPADCPVGPITHS